MMPPEFHGKCCADTRQHNRYRHRILQQKKRKCKTISKHKGEYLSRSILFCSDCKIISQSVSCNIPGTMNICTLTCFVDRHNTSYHGIDYHKNFHCDANKENGRVSQRPTCLVHSVSTTFSKEYYSLIWPMSSNKKYYLCSV